MMDTHAFRITFILEAMLVVSINHVIQLLRHVMAKSGLRMPPHHQNHEFLVV